MVEYQLIYKNKSIIEEIQKASDKVLFKNMNAFSFEERVHKRIYNYVRSDRNRMKNVRYIKRLIYETCTAFINERRQVEIYNFSNLEELDDEGNEQNFEPVDVLADVEDEIIAKEMAALLAQDSRTKIILDAWLLGNTNTSEISSILADTLGGKVEAHRKYVRRFKNQCREKLIDVA